MHIQNRHQLIDWVARNATDTQVRRYINHGIVVYLGRFYGGFVLTLRPHNLTDIVVLGIKQKPPFGELAVGRLSHVPWGDYIGGTTPIEAGDFPDRCLEKRRDSFKYSGDHEQNNPNCQRTGEPDQPID